MTHIEVSFKHQGTSFVKRIDVEEVPGKSLRDLAQEALEPTFPGLRILRASPCGVNPDLRKKR